MRVVVLPAKMRECLKQSPEQTLDVKGAYVLAWHGDIPRATLECDKLLWQRVAKLLLRASNALRGSANMVSSSSSPLPLTRSPRSTSMLSAFSEPMRQSWWLRRVVENQQDRGPDFNHVWFAAPFSWLTLSALSKPVCRGAG